MSGSAVPTGPVRTQGAPRAVSIQVRVRATWARRSRGPDCREGSRALSTWRLQGRDSRAPRFSDEETKTQELSTGPGHALRSGRRRVPPGPLCTPPWPVGSTRPGAGRGWRGEHSARAVGTPEAGQRRGTSCHLSVELGPERDSTAAPAFLAVTLLGEPASPPPAAPCPELTPRDTDLGDEVGKRGPGSIGIGTPRAAATDAWWGPVGTREGRPPDLRGLPRQDGGSRAGHALR